MDNTFAYIPNIFTIKSTFYNTPPLTYPDQTINTNILDAHKALLRHCQYKYDRALIFQNDMRLLDLPDVSEISTFFDNNVWWDMIILGDHDRGFLEYTWPVNDRHHKYKNLYRLPDDTTFMIDSPYIASMRLFDKVANNNLDKIIKYWFKPKYLGNHNFYLQPPYAIGKVNTLEHIPFYEYWHIIVKENEWTQLPIQ